MSEPLIEMHNITFAYPGSPQPVFQDFNFQLLPGNHLGLIGPNGSGKTTMLHLIMGLLRPQAGRIVIFGQEVKKNKDFIHIRQKVGLLFQNADDQLFCPTVMEDVAFGPLNQGKPPAEAIHIARETMARLGLAGLRGPGDLQAFRRRKKAGGPGRGPGHAAAVAPVGRTHRWPG
jgi:cobalt/nickel transport system ATP-binding protein